MKNLLVRIISLLALFALLLSPLGLVLQPEKASALFSPTGSLGLVASGSKTQASGTGVVVNMVQPAASSYTILIDASSVATSTCTIAIQVLSPNDGAAPGTYVAPQVIGSSGGTAQAAGTITITNALSYVIVVPGGYPGIQVSVTSWGTATGTIYASITAS